MYDQIIYYCVIMCLLVPIATEDASYVLLWLGLIMALTATTMYNSPVNLYLCAITGEAFNIIAYTRLSSDSKTATLTVLSLWAIALNVMVWIDPFANVLYIHYELLNTLLIEATIIVLTFKVSTDGTLRKLINRAS